MSQDALAEESLGRLETSSPTSPAENLKNEIPYSYGLTEIVLLPRDPHWMYAYWDVTPQMIEEMQKQYGENVLYATTPTLRLVQLEIENDRPTPLRCEDISVRLEARNWYLHSQLEGAAYWVEIGLLFADGKFALLARSNWIRLPQAGISDEIDDRWVILHSEMHQILQASGVGANAQGSLELARQLSHRWEFLRHDVGGSAGFSSLALGQAHAIQQRNRKFWLMADCELVLYGATEPDASVEVAGKPVALNPDGTFTLRFSLPPGELALPVNAVSGDRVEKRWIKISVERRTEKGS